MIVDNTGRDFWDMKDEFDALLITTNGVLAKDGRLVMGAGIAKQCAVRHPTIPKTLGDWVQFVGNVPCCIHGNNRAIISFPTKHHWATPSRIELISASAVEIVKIVNKWQFKKILSTAPGCGLGKLEWDVVRPVLEGIFDNRFTVIRPR